MTARTLPLVLLALAATATMALAESPATPPAAARLSIEAHVASYKYRETEEDGSEFMNYRGRRVGIGARVSRVNERRVVTAGEVRYSRARLDYTGSGTMSGVPDYYYDFRFLAGQQLDRAGGTLTPYVGLGWRHLVNDSSGMTTSTNHYGYARISDYHYLPLGLDWSIPAGRGAVELNAEVNILLRGTQKSKLDGETVTNRQGRGRGYRLGALWTDGTFALGPYLQAWKIDKSSEDPCAGGLRVCWEPKNTTTEAGLRVRYGFR